MTSNVLTDLVVGLVHEWFIHTSLDDLVVGLVHEWFIHTSLDDFKCTHRLNSRPSTRVVHLHITRWLSSRPSTRVVHPHITRWLQMPAILAADFTVWPFVFHWYQLISPAIYTASIILRGWNPPQTTVSQPLDLPYTRKYDCEIIAFRNNNGLPLHAMKNLSKDVNM